MESTSLASLLPREAGPIVHDERAAVLVLDPAEDVDDARNAVLNFNRGVGPAELCYTTRDM